MFIKATRVLVSSGARSLWRAAEYQPEALGNRMQGMLHQIVAPLPRGRVVSEYGEALESQCITLMMAMPDVCYAPFADVRRPAEVFRKQTLPNGAVSLV